MQRNVSYSAGFSETLSAHTEDRNKEKLKAIPKHRTSADSIVMHPVPALLCLQNLTQKHRLSLEKFCG